MIIESIIFVAFVVAISLSLSIRNKNKFNSVGLIYTFFSLGTFLFFLSKLFLELGIKGIYQINSTHLHIWWHLIFYFGTTCFIVGGIRLKQISNNVDVKAYKKKDTLMIMTFILFTSLIFLFSNKIDQTLLNFKLISIIDRYGIHQFVSLLLNICAIYYVLSIKNITGRVLSKSAYPIVLFLSLTSIQYIWEIFTESYVLLHFSEKNIEMVESIIIMLSLFSLIYGYLLTYKESYNNQNKL